MTVDSVSLYSLVYLLHLPLITGAIMIRTLVFALLSLASIAHAAGSFQSWFYDSVDCQEPAYALLATVSNAQTDALQPSLHVPGHGVSNRALLTRSLLTCCSAINCMACVIL